MNGTFDFESNHHLNCNFYVGSSLRRDFLNPNHLFGCITFWTIVLLVSYNLLFNGIYISLFLKPVLFSFSRLKFILPIIKHDDVHYLEYHLEKYLFYFS